MPRGIPSGLRPCPTAPPAALSMPNVTRRTTRSRPGHPLTGAELAAWRGLLRIAVRLRRELDRRLRERHEISLADYDALVVLAEQRGRRLRMSDLADAIL